MVLVDERKLSWPSNRKVGLRGGKLFSQRKGCEMHLGLLGPGQWYIILRVDENQVPAHSHS